MVWQQSTWWIIGGASLAFTAVSLLRFRQTIVALFVADAAAVLLWILWAIQSFAVEQTTEAGITVTHNYPALGYLGIAFAFLMALDLFLSVFEAMAAEFRGDT